MPIFISCFIFVSLGINYYVLEYKSKSMVENSTKDLVLYEKIAMLEKNISNTPQKEDKNNYQKDIEDLRNKNKALEEAIALSTEALMKQKMEIATLVEKINIVSGGSDGSDGGSAISFPEECSATSSIWSSSTSASRPTPLTKCFTFLFSSADWG